MLKNNSKNITKSIIHVDMDAFYAAVEIRDNPQLKGKPVIIGAKPNERGVVATCSYEARAYGVRSAMSISQAYRLCPNGIYIQPNMEKYRLASKKIREIWQTYTDLIDYISLDEGYLDITASEHLFFGSKKVGLDIQARILAQLGLSASVGVGYSMMSAKIASEEKKPNGFFVINNQTELLQLISERSCRVIPSIGKQNADKLEKFGIFTVRDIINNKADTVKTLGKLGYVVYELANGIDTRPVGVAAPAKSLSHEHTFQKDIGDINYLYQVLHIIAKKLGFQMQSKHIFAKTITLKLTFSNMVQISRSKSGEYINKPREIYSVALSLLNKAEKKPVRLIGISLSGFSKHAPKQISIFDNNIKTKQEKLDELAFSLQYKYGIDIIKTGKELNFVEK